MAAPKQLDGIDAEQLEELVDSKGWRLVKKGLENLREAKLRDLVRQHTEVETARLRGEIEACDKALAMPATLIAEARRGGKLNA